MTEVREISWPAASCCAPNYPMGCVCPPAEKALRAIAGGRLFTPMTDEQREWCRKEINSVEGHDARDCDDDTDLANGVLMAWTDYCRDKGLM